ncbi:MAG: hypothetical protein ACKVRP_04145 [Bacteroidota bacterium]
MTMTDHSSSQALVKVGSTSIARYSSTLVRRAVEEITQRSPELIRSVTKLRRILLIADELGLILKDILYAEGFEVNIVKSYGRLDEIYSELTRLEYDMVIPTNNSLRAEDIPDLVREIKLRHPRIRILVLSGYNSLDFISQLQEHEIDGFFSLPPLIDELVPRIKELLCT